MMKKLSKDEMKKVMGGQLAPPDQGVYACQATATCASGSTISCSGYSVGSIGGCAATDANTIYNSGADGQVSCIEWVDFGSGGSFYSYSWNCAAAT
jgi:bacteriocin-like protein